MKARITHMKAPWPEGAAVGAVVLFAAGAVPAWAAGKCVEAGEADEPTLVVPAAPEATQPAGSEADQVREEAGRFIADLRADFERHAADLQAKLDAALATQADLQQQLANAAEVKAAALAQVADLQAKLDAASGTKKK
jgi:hypothetical protein